VARTRLILAAITRILKALWPDPLKPTGVSKCVAVIERLESLGIVNTAAVISSAALTEASLAAQLAMIPAAPNNSAQVATQDPVAQAIQRMPVAQHAIDCLALIVRFIAVAVPTASLDPSIGGVVQRVIGSYCTTLATSVIAPDTISGQAWSGWAIAAEANASEGATTTTGSVTTPEPAR
jgi:hypothetical protein